MLSTRLLTHSSLTQPHISAWAVATCRCSPEMLTEGRCTAKADIFSLGIVMWEIVTQVWHPA